MRTTVIIPSTCEEFRAPMLRRAILSCLAQGNGVEVLVVANGPRVCDTALKTVEQLGARLLRQSVGNVSLARYAGVQAASGDFFCFLDDDDELLPGSVEARLGAFTADIDIVVSNGLDRTQGGTDTQATPPAIANAIAGDLIGSFLTHNWFASAAPLFRSKTISTSLFNIEDRYFEWTILFFSLALGGFKFRHIDFLGFVRYQDNPTSASKTNSYALAHPTVIASIIDRHSTTGLTTRHRKQLVDKLIRAYNTTAQLFIAQNNLREAWLAHLHCIRLGGWRYLPFTRHLLVQSVKRKTGPVA